MITFIEKILGEKMKKAPKNLRSEQNTGLQKQERKTVCGVVYSANGGICVNGKQTEEGKRVIGKM